MTLMTYLLRVQLPDIPGSLGYLAAALGEVNGDIRSVDVVDYGTDGTVIDDLVVDIPHDTLPDALITAAQSLDDVEVDSIRPFSGTVDRRGQIRMLAKLAKAKKATQAFQGLVDGLPGTMTAGWALVLENGRDGSRRLVASDAAPEDDGRVLHSSPVDSARVLELDTDDWLPDSWTVMESSLAAAPMGQWYTLIMGRPGGPDFLATEVQHLGRIGDIVGAIVN